MGQGISNEQVAAHLARQSELITQLQDVVEKQSRTIEVTVMKNTEAFHRQKLMQQLNTNNNGNTNTADGASSAVVNPIIGGANGPTASLRDELEVLPSEARATENNRREIPISEDELAAENIAWTAPTAEEEKHLTLTKPWLAAMAPPTNFEFGKADGTPPISLQLERVYGYRAACARNTAFWITADVVVYYVGSIGISLNVKTNTQKFFTGHSEDITSIAVDRQRQIVATGESGRFPAIYIWNAITGEFLAKLAGRHRRAVAALAFGRDGSTLASVGIDDSNTVLVYNWGSGKVIGEGSSRTRILDITPNYSVGRNPNVDFVTAGDESVLFWTSASSIAAGSKGAPSKAASPADAAAGKASANNADGPAAKPAGTESEMLHVTSARFGSSSSGGPSSSSSSGGGAALGVKQQPFLCVRSTRTHTLVGTTDGHLYAFRDERLVFSMAVHQGPVHSIEVVPIRGEADVLGEGTSTPRSTKLVRVAAAATAAAEGASSFDVSPPASAFAGPPPEIRVFTAGRDGYVSCWDIDTRQQEFTLNLNKKASAASVLKFGTNAVRSLNVMVDASSSSSSSSAPSMKVLVGTINGTLAMCTAGGGRAASSADDYTPITNGHSADLSSSGAIEGELWGLAAAPATSSPASASLFATCGEDAMLRLWDSSSQKMMIAVELPRAAQCVAFSRDGNSIAVGYLNGAVGIFTIHHKKSKKKETSATDSSSFVELRELTEMRRCARRIQCLQFSPCSKWLAAGTADGNVDLYAITKDDTTATVVDGAGGEEEEEDDTANGATLLNYTLKLRLTNNNNSVCMRFDFSRDGRYVQACSQSYELLFYDLASEVTPGKVAPQIFPLSCAAAREAVKDVDWYSYSSFLGWSVQGVWLSSHADGTDVNAVRRSHNSKYLLTGCDSGHLRVFNYPCVGSGLDREGRLARRPMNRAFTGHGKHIAEVVWSADDSKVFSIGASDRCCMQWRVVDDGAAASASAAAE